MTSDSENDKLMAEALRQLQFKSLLKPQEDLYRMIRASHGLPFSSLDRRIGESDANFIIRQSYGGGPSGRGSYN